MTMLNPSQQKAVNAVSGPVRIIAGAGTGKTMTLIHRIVHLVRGNGALKRRILTLTFTNKAAREMTERLSKQGLTGARAMTFHALAAGFLRKYKNPDFKIISQKERDEIIKELLLPGEDLKTVATAMEQETLTPAKTDSRLQDILAAYQMKLEERNAYDFSGLIIGLLSLWKEQPDVLTSCQKEFEYILVDEYQDVSPVQAEIVRLLGAPHQNICIVGDPDQTIYSWRGASDRSMAEFMEDYPEALSVTLTQNYRNPPAVLKGAEALICHNPDRIEKELTPFKTAGPSPVSFWESSSDWQAQEKLFHILEKHLGSHSDMHMADTLDTGESGSFRPFSDIAILYRTQAEGKKLAAQLARRAYPCQTSAPESFWQRSEVAEFLSETEKLLPAIQSSEPKLSGWLRERITCFSDSKKLKNDQQNRLNHLIACSMPLDHLPLEEALLQFLDETKIQQEADNLTPANRINLLTLHAAKGLEFPVVLIFGLEEGSIPHKKLTDDPYWLAEERRLLYVGMTRATEELHLFYTKQEDKKPSRFLAEIGYENLPPACLPEKENLRIRKREIKKSQMKMF